MNAETTQRKIEKTRTTADSRRKTAPTVDIYENKEEVLLIADLPGVAADTLSIKFEKDELTIAGTRPTAPDGNHLAAEFSKYDFQRTFVVPQGIRPEDIHAEMAHGVLKIHLPKRQRAVRQIAVKAS